MAILCYLLLGFFFSAECDVLLRNVTPVNVERIAVTSQEKLTSSSTLNNSRDVRADGSGRCAKLVRWSDTNLIDQLPVQENSSMLLALHLDAMTSHSTREVLVSDCYLF